MTAWYVSTIAEDASEIAREYGLGLEIAEFCTPYNMDEDFTYWDTLVRKNIQGIAATTLHAPFSELCGAAIDPLVRDVTLHRFEQAYDLALTYGAGRMVVHSGFMPMLYNAGWFTEHLVAFWKGFLQDKDTNCVIVLENVFESEPTMLVDIVQEVNDPRFRLCLDLGHANSSGRTTPLSTWIDAFGPWLSHVHVHNNHGDYDSHLDPGDGSIDMRSVLPQLRGLHGDITFTLECPKAKRAIDWLKQQGLLW